MREFIANFILWIGVFGSCVIAVPGIAQNSPASGDQTASLRYTLAVEPDTLQTNSTVTYTIRIENTPGSGEQLDSVMAVFTVPQLENGRLLLEVSSFQLVAGDPPIGYPANPVDQAGQIKWDLGSISRGAENAKTIVISFRVADIAKISLQACGENYLTATLDVTAKDRGRIVRPGPRSVESILDVRPDLWLGEISGPLGANRGETISFTIRYSNYGNVGDSAVVCVRLPFGADVNNVQTDPPGITQIIKDSDSLCFDVGFVPADSVERSLTIRFPMTGFIPADTLLTCMRVSIDSPCDTLQTNNIRPAWCMDIDPLDLLRILKLGTPDTAAVGDTLRFTIIYENVDDNVTARNIRIVDVLPPGTQLVSADTPFVFLNNTLSWQLDSLAPGTSRMLHYSVLIPRDFYNGQPATIACNGVVIRNRVEITSTGPMGQPSPESPIRRGNNEAIKSVFVEPLADLLAITVNDVDINRVNPSSPELLPGDTLIFSLKFCNKNDRLSANNVTLENLLPDAVLARLLPPVPANFSHDPSNNRLLRQNFALAPQECDSISFRLVIRTDITTCTAMALLNRVIIRDSLEFDCHLANNDTTITLQIPATGDLLALDITAVPRQVNTLGPVNYTLTYRNVGNIDALNVTVADTLPPEIEFLSSTPPPSRRSPGDSLLFWDIGTLPLGASGAIVINARVRNLVACDSVSLRTRAGISSSPTDCSEANNTDAVTVTFITDPAQQPQLVVQNVRFDDENGDNAAEPGELIDVQLDFFNQSQLTASGLDTLNMLVSPGAVERFDFTPANLPSGQNGTVTLQVRVGESDFADSLIIAGRITAVGFCPRPFRAAYLFKPRARVDIIAVAIDDRQGDRNGCAGEAEQLNIVVVYENVSATRADSVDLRVTIEPAGYDLLGSNPALTEFGPPPALGTRVALDPGQRDSLFLQIRYPDFTPQHFFVKVSATLQVSAISGFLTPTENTIAVCRDCYARPNPFIPGPDWHFEGVRFAPNDGQKVEIFDIQGNRVRSLNTQDRWDGKDKDGRDCPAGVYLWVIEGHCRGTIVLAR